MRKLELAFALLASIATACTGELTLGGAAGGASSEGGMPPAGGARTAGAGAAGDGGTGGVGVAGVVAGSTAIGGGKSLALGGSSAAGSFAAGGKSSAAGGKGFAAGGSSTGSEGYPAGAGGAGADAGAAGSRETGSGGSGAGGTGAGGKTTGSGGAGGQCSALPLKCGDRLNHSTTYQGRVNTWSGYGLSQRGESGRETVYAFSSDGECAVIANLKNLTTDLDLFLLLQCSIESNIQASSTPIDLQTVETLSWVNPKATTRYVVVDGYAGAEGSYTLEVDCTCIN